MKKIYCSNEAFKLLGDIHSDQFHNDFAIATHYIDANSLKPRGKAKGKKKKETRNQLRPRNEITSVPFPS